MCPIGDTLNAMLTSDYSLPSSIAAVAIVSGMKGGMQRNDEERAYEKVVEHRNLAETGLIETQPFPNTH